MVEDAEDRLISRGELRTVEEDEELLLRGEVLGGCSFVREVPGW